MPGRKGEKGLLLVGREKVPHGFGLTRDCGSHTTDGAGSLNHGLLLLFLRYVSGIERRLSSGGGHFEPSRISLILVLRTD